ncbi:MAG: hypothetical protein HZA63_17935 [Rhodocyclales bacterium]|nr:hypothetical protein [Rhodocyclales bacterium]
MSKLLTGLMEAERRRQQIAAAGTPPPAAAIDAGRNIAASVASTNARAEAEAALAQRAALQEQSDRHTADQAGELVLAERRLEAEARKRVEQEAAAALAAGARIEAERTAVEALERRIEEEAAALAAAQQNEHVAAELAAAAAERAAKEVELARLATDRAAAERCAADRAATQLQAQRAAEAAARSRAAAEEDALQQTRRRVELEAEASRAAARLKSAGAARDVTDSASGQDSGSEVKTTADIAMAGPAKIAAREADQPDEVRPAAFGRLVAAVALSMGVGVAAGFWLGGPVQAPATSPGSVVYTPPAIDPDAPFLRLDHALRAVPNVTPQNLTGEP